MLLLDVTGRKSFRPPLPKTTLPLTKNTVAAVARVIPFEHPFPNRQKQSASTPLNETEGIGNLRDQQRSKPRPRAVLDNQARGFVSPTFNCSSTVRERHYLCFASTRRASTNILPARDKPDLNPTQPGIDVP